MPPFSQIGQTIFNLLNSYGQHAMFIIILAEEAGIPLPIPGDFFLLYLGLNLANSSLTKIIFAAIWSTAGVVIGSSILYLLSKYGGRPLFENFGKYVMITPERLKKIDLWFKKHHRYAVFIGRFVPGLRILISAFAGVTQMRYSNFILQVTTSSLLWSLIFLSIGYFFGSKSLAIVHLVNQLSFFLLIGAITTITINILKSRR